MTTAHPSSYLLLANRHASRVSTPSIEAVRGVLEERAQVDVVEVWDISTVDSALHAFERATPVVAGGDGSLAAVLRALARRQRLDATAIGLVPLGAGNDVARAIGLPLDPVAAAEVVVEGRVAEMDLLLHGDDGIVVNVLHFGLGYRASRNAGRLKTVLGKRAYIIGAIGAGARGGRWPVTLQFDGGPLIDMAASMVFVCNGGTVGGGVRVIPGAALDDGQIEVVAVEPMLLRRRVVFGLRLLAGTHLGMAEVHRHSCREVTVSCEGGYVSDGEIHALRTAGTLRLAPRSWRLITRSPQGE